MGGSREEDVRPHSLTDVARNQLFGIVASLSEDQYCLSGTGKPAGEEEILASLSIFKECHYFGM